MEVLPLGGGADLKGVRPGGSGPVCISRNNTLSTLVLPHASSCPRIECCVCTLFPDCSGPGSSEECLPEQGPSTSGSPVLAGPSLFLRPSVPP